MAGDPGAMAMNAPMVPTLAASIPELTMWRPRKSSGREPILPASLRKATMEPVKVIPPGDVSYLMACRGE